jgi:hypothetical protein
MRKTILRYGSYAGLFEFIAFVLTWLVIYLLNAGHEFQGYIGYVSIISPLIFIYFGIRYYRDRVNNGSVTFLKALKIGLLIVIIPAVSFAIVETVYVLYIDPKFYENVAAYDISEYRKSLPPAEFAIKLKEIKQEITLNNNPLNNFTAMILYVGALGAIITLISSLLLMRKVKKETAK